MTSLDYNTILNIQFILASMEPQELKLKLYQKIALRIILGCFMEHLFRGIYSHISVTQIDIFMQGVGVYRSRKQTNWISC